MPYSTQVDVVDPLSPVPLESPSLRLVSSSLLSSSSSPSLSYLSSSSLSLNSSLSPSMAPGPQTSPNSDSTPKSSNGSSRAIIAGSTTGCILLILLSIGAYIYWRKHREVRVENVGQNYTIERYITEPRNGIGNLRSGVGVVGLRSSGQGTLEAHNIGDVESSSGPLPPDAIPHSRSTQSHIFPSNPPMYEDLSIANHNHLANSVTSLTKHNTFIPYYNI